MDSFDSLSLSICQSRSVYLLNPQNSIQRRHSADEYNFLLISEFWSVYV